MDLDFAVEYWVLFDETVAIYVEVVVDAAADVVA